MNARRCYLRMGSDYLDDAKPHASLRAAREAYAETARRLYRYGQRIEASVHIAASRDELAEYPDFILEIGPRGGVRMEAA